MRSSEADATPEISRKEFHYQHNGRNLKDGVGFVPRNRKNIYKNMIEIVWLKSKILFIETIPVLPTHKLIQNTSQFTNLLA